MRVNEPVGERCNRLRRGSTVVSRIAQRVPVLVAFAVSGCATAIPLPSLISHDDVTGSISTQVSPLSSTLDGEDWRRARAALAVALDPQGNGAAVAWDNPVSGVRGSFTAVGDAYPSDERICRAFLADVGGRVAGQKLQGVGCRDRAGDWAVKDVKPWKESA